MPKTKGLLLLGFFIPVTVASAQIQRTSMPMGDAIQKAYAKSSLTGPDARPFHLRVNVSEPENRESPYVGTIEYWWTSPQQWRREVTDKDGLHQTVVVNNGQKTEKDEGDYFPFWLREFVTAVSDPIPNAAAWSRSGLSIEQITMPNGAKSDPCIRAQSKIGTGDRATDAFTVVCFDSEWRLKSYISPGYSMEFNEYKGFGKKQIAHKLVDDPEPGTELVGDVVKLEDLKPTADLFQPLATNDNRFLSAHVTSEQMESLTANDPAIQWPSVRSGITHGHLAMYISADAQGQVRETWPLNSDNAGLEDPARAQVMKWKLKPAVDKNGNRLQVEGGLGFVFDAATANPIPVLSDQEARQLAIKTVAPKFPAGTPVGTRYRVRIAVNEKGMVTGGAAGDTEVPGTIQPPGPALFPIMTAVEDWRFRPLMKNGAPQYFFAELVFVVQ